MNNFEIMINKYPIIIIIYPFLFILSAGMVGKVAANNSIILGVILFILLNIFIYYMHIYEVSKNE